MRAHMIRPGELRAEDLARWQEIIDGSSLYRSPFYSPHFTLAVGETRRDARVAVLERDGEVIGFLPCHLLRGRVAKPIGGPINDYQGPILDCAAPVDGPELLKACGLRAYDFNHLPVAMNGLAGSAHTRSVSPFIDLSDGYEAYVQGRGKPLKKVLSEMRRRTRNAARDFGGEVVFTVHDPSPDTYAEHVTFKNASLAREGVKSTLDVGWVADTLEILRTTQTPEFAGLMSTVRAGETLLGTHFGIRSARDWHWWFPSYDAEHRKYGPGIMVIHGAAEATAGLGLERIDFGRGNSEYKLVMGTGHVDLCEGSIERVASPAGVLRKAQKGMLGLARPLPLGRYESYPRRALARLISGMQLPGT